jgi:hypothetical protein
MGMSNPVEIFLSLQPEIIERELKQPTIDSLIEVLQHNAALPLTEIGMHDILVRFTKDDFEPTGVSTDIARVVNLTDTTVTCLWDYDGPRKAEYSLETGISTAGLGNGWVTRAEFRVAPETS